MARNFKELSAPINADPRRRARVEADKRAIYASLHLAELRKRRKMTQKQVAESMGVSQARVSQIERGERLELATISEYVAVLGAQLELSAAFPGEPAVSLTEAC